MIDGYQYSRFCELYQQWAGRVDLVMRHHHRAGDKLFIDYAGQTIPIYPPGAPSCSSPCSGPATSPSPQSDHVFAARDLRGLPLPADGDERGDQVGGLGAVSRCRFRSGECQNAVDVGLAE
jgi:hypothetical protein